MRRCSLFWGLVLGLGWFSCGPVAVGAVQVNPPGVTLTWNPSSDPDVIGYSLYYGPASRSYTNRVDVGTSTNSFITGLDPGSTTFFAAAAYDQAGTESIFSNEVIYTAPGILRVQIGADNLLHVTFPANAGHRYEVQASTSLGPWTTISSVLAQSTGWLDVIDTSWTGATSRFYRIVLH